VLGIRQSELRKVALRSATRRAKSHRAVLGALDDKIELNGDGRDVGGDARAVFQSWFVDFDPVRANLTVASPPASTPPPRLFSLTNSKIQSSLDSEGWTIEPVGDVVSCVGGSTPSTAEPKFWEGELIIGRHQKICPCYKRVLIETERRITDQGVAKISSGLLPAGTLLLSSRAPVGYLVIATMPVAINQGFIAMKCNERASNYFMLNCVDRTWLRSKAAPAGRRIAEISKHNFRPIPVVLPPKELMAAFTEKLARLYAQIIANLHQSRTLAMLRDTLLPHLMRAPSPSRKAKLIMINTVWEYR